MTKSKCSVEGCNGQTRGKNYCTKHLREKRGPAVISKEARMTMRSACCKAGCVNGVKHEYGEQYCEKCKEACQWKVAV